jgi:hypothetical protein
MKLRQAMIAETFKRTCFLRAQAMQNPRSKAVELTDAPTAASIIRRAPPIPSSVARLRKEPSDLRHGIRSPRARDPPELNKVLFFSIWGIAEISGSPPIKANFTNSYNFQRFFH